MPFPKTISSLKSKSFGWWCKQRVLEHGHTDNLMHETDDMRVWLSRLTVEDGMPYNDQVTVEQFNNGRGRWETVAQFRAGHFTK